MRKTQLESDSDERSGEDWNRTRGLVDALSAAMMIRVREIVVREVAFSKKQSGRRNERPEEGVMDTPE